MLLNEIELNNLSKNVNIHQFSYAEEYFDSLEYLDTIEPNIALYSFPDSHGMLLYLIDTSKKNDNIIGEIGLNPELSFGHEPTSYIANEYQGRNLGFKTYKYIILKLNLILVSSRSQSKGSSYLWTKLWHDPKILVCGLRVINNEKEYFQVEPDEFDPQLLTGKYKIYKDLPYDFVKDSQDYQTLINDMYTHNEITEKEYEKLIYKYSILTSQEQEENSSAASYTYLIAIKK